MAATALPPQNAVVGNPNFDGNPAIGRPPGTDMTGICFRDKLWLTTYPLDRNLVFDYFVLSPFYDWSQKSVHPSPRKMTGIEYMLSEVMEPHLFVFRKENRDGVEKVTPIVHSDSNFIL